MTDSGKRQGLEEAFAVARRRGWLALIVFVVPFTIAASLAVFLPAIYRSSATVLVDRQQIPEAFVRPTVTSALETRLQTITQEVLSRSRLEQLITRFGLYPELRKHASTEVLIERMRQDIQLEIKGVDPRGRGSATVAFALSYRGPNPSTVAQVTNTIASFYIEENLRVREKQATGTAEFLKVQLQETKKRLDEQERRVSAFKSRYMGELPEQLPANLATLERLHAQLRINTDNQIKALERRDAMARQRLDEEATPVSLGAPGAPAAPDAAAVRLTRLRQELTELRAQFRERYPDVVRLRAEIAALEREAPTMAPPDAESEGEPRPPVSPSEGRLRQLLAETEADLKAMKADEAQLRTAIAAYQRRVENVPRREQEFEELSRDYQTTKELYRTLLGRYEEAQLAESMEQRQKGEQFRVLDAALPADEPVAPKRARMVVLGLVLSLGLAVLSAVTAEKTDTSFHAIDDLRAFSPTPVLASIPRIATDGDVRRRRWRTRLGVAALVVGIGGLVILSYLAAEHSEQIMSLLARRTG
jgi:polysaccharide chain length determinant protein (PEP-CTERM system associated)